MKWLIYGAIVSLALIGKTVHFFVGTLWGVLILSVIAYAAAPAVSEIEPLTATQLLFWFANLSEGAQVAVSAGLLTAIGLVAAYWTALAAWKKQKEMELKLAAADEIEARFQIALRCCHDIGAFLSTLVHSVDEARAIDDAESQAIRLHYSNSRAAFFEEQKAALHEARMNFHGLTATYSMILANSFGLFDKFRAVAESLDEACRVCAFRAPRGDSQSPQFVIQFLSRYDEERSRHALSTLDRISNETSAAIGFVTGRLRSNVIAPTTSGVLTLLRHPRLYASSLNLVRALKPQKEPDTDGQK